jgi:hypothetical protein
MLCLRSASIVLLSQSFLHIYKSTQLLLSPPALRHVFPFCHGPLLLLLLLLLLPDSLYDTLGVASTASERDIKRAYRQKALKLHPDVNKAVGTSGINLLVMLVMQDNL